MSLCPPWHCTSLRSEWPWWLSTHWISACSQAAKGLNFYSLDFLLVPNSLNTDMMGRAVPRSCCCAFFPFMTVNQCKDVFLLLVKYLVKLTMKFTDRRGRLLKKMLSQIIFFSVRKKCIFSKKKKKRDKEMHSYTSKQLHLGCLHQLNF